MKHDYSQIENSMYRLFEITPIPMVLSLPNGKLEYVNPALNTMLGYENDIIYSDNIIITHLEDIHINEDIRARLNKDPFTPIKIDKRYKHKLGHAIYVQLNIVAQADASGEVVRYISQLIDLTTIKQSDAAEILLNHLVNQSNDAIYVVDAKFGQILNCNRLAHRRLGYSKSELLKLNVVDIQPKLRLKEQLKEHFDRIKDNGNLIIESSHLRKDGTEFPVEDSISFIEYNGAEYILAIVRDISRRKKKELEALEAANLDPLTKLPNRSVLENKLEQVFVKAEKNNTLVAFMYIDLDNFKQINDSYGHTIGDGILVGTANRLKHCVRKSDIVTRLGGDEFLVILSGIGNKMLVEPMANKLLTEFDSPFHIQSQIVKVEASIGVSVYMDKNTDVHTLIQLADEAMYQAKKQAGTSIYYI